MEIILSISALFVALWVWLYLDSKKAFILEDDGSISPSRN